MSGPPPPPPHGGVPRGSGLPPGKYDIFVIPEHSSGGGFLYLPSMRPNVNSFAAGFASALIMVVMFQTMAPAFRTWWDNFQGLGNMAMSMLVIGVGFGAWSLGRIQSDRKDPRSGRNASGGHGSEGGFRGTSFRSAPDEDVPPPPPHGTPPPPPPHGTPPRRSSHKSHRASRDEPSPQSRGPPKPPPHRPEPEQEPEPQPPPKRPPQAKPPPQSRPPPPQTPPQTPPKPEPKRAPSPPSEPPKPDPPKPDPPKPEPPKPDPPKPEPPKPEPPKPEPPKSEPPKPEPPKPEPPKPEPSKAEPPKPETPKQKGKWEKAREETRKKEEERKAKEAEQKRREEAAKRLAELRAKDAKERQEREKERERREREIRERKERIEAEQLAKDLAEKLEHERKERARLEKEAKEAREREARRLKEVEELEERKKKETQEREERRKKLAAEREAMRKKEAAERTAREEAQKQREQAEKEQAEKEKAEKEKAEREKAAKEKSEKEKAEREKAAAEKAAAERAAAERAAAERAAVERAVKERAERERIAREKAEQERIEREKAAEAASPRSGSYAFSGVGERMSMWPNGRPPAPAPSTTSTASRTPAPSAAGTASPKKPVPSSARSGVSGVSTENSYRPYDRAKRPQHKKSTSSLGSESSWAPSHSTARTSPPPSMRGGPYSTNDPDKIVISGVYLFMNQFAKTPASQLVSGLGAVTDGLILRITTEGLFIDDDVRGVPQREWDVKAWTLKQVEVWCPPQCLNSSSSPPTHGVANSSNLRHKTAASRSRERGAAKPLTGDEADVYLAEMLRACKDCCHAGLCERRFKDANIPFPSGQTGEWKSKGLHVLRAVIRDQESKRYVFVIDESEAWKVSVGLQRLRKGSQVRQLGVAAMSPQEARGTLDMLGWT